MTEFKGDAKDVEAQEEFDNVNLIVPITRAAVDSDPRSVLVRYKAQPGDLRVRDIAFPAPEMLSTRIETAPEIVGDPARLALVSLGMRHFALPEAHLTPTIRAHITSHGMRIAQEAWEGIRATWEPFAVRGHGYAPPEGRRIIEFQWGWAPAAIKRVREAVASGVGGGAKGQVNGDAKGESKGDAANVIATEGAPAKVDSGPPESSRLVVVSLGLALEKPVHYAVPEALVTPAVRAHIHIDDETGEWDQEEMPLAEFHKVVASWSRFIVPGHHFSCPADKTVVEFLCGYADKLY